MNQISTPTDREKLATEEFSALLMMPCPKTDKDYRRAIILAGICGRVLEDAQKSREPTFPGGEKFQCRMLNGAWQVYGVGLAHVCMCDSEAIGEDIATALNKHRSSGGDSHFTDK